MEELNIQQLLYGVNSNFNVDLPTGRTAIVREMTGHDQRKFINKASITNGSAINNLLVNCTESIDDKPLGEDEKTKLQAVLDLLEGDRQALLFAIRRASLGDEFTFTMDCPSCKKRDTWEVSLASSEAFKMVPYPCGTTKTLDFEWRGLKIKVNLLDGNGSTAALKRMDSADILTDLEIRSPRVDNGHGVWQSVKLNKVPDSFISEMRRQLRIAEGRLDTSVTVYCKNCGDPAKFDLLQVPDFMIPNVTY